MASFSEKKLAELALADIIPERVKKEYFLQKDNEILKEVLEFCKDSGISQRDFLSQMMIITPGERGDRPMMFRHLDDVKQYAELARAAKSEEEVQLAIKVLTKVRELCSEFVDEATKQMRREKTHEQYLKSQNGEETDTLPWQEQAPVSGTYDEYLTTLHDNNSWKRYMKVNGKEMRAIIAKDNTKKPHYVALKEEKLNIETVLDYEHYVLHEMEFVLEKMLSCLKNGEEIPVNIKDEWYDTEEFFELI
eukprot:g73.t1